MPRRRPPAQGALDGRAHPAVRGRDAGAGDRRPAARLHAGGCSGSSTTVRSSAATSPPTVGPGGGVRRLLSIVRRPQLLRVLALHAGSRASSCRPTASGRSRATTASIPTCSVDGTEHRVDYEPAESSTGLFGGNSNWRGPIWFPVNYLLIESLQKFHHFYGDDLKVECPTGSSRLLNLWEVAAELSRRLTRLFLRGRDGRRPVYGGYRALPARPALARPHPLLRVLPRRRGERDRRQPPDRLDGPGGQAHRAERGVTTRREVSPGWTRSGPRVRWHRRSEDGAVAIE